MTSLDLLGCPFCGNPNLRPATQGNQTHITCPRCHCTGPRATTLNDAQLLWSERPFRRALEASRKAEFEDTARQLFGVMKL